ncbi:unnamed protein product [Mytilus coruscus]|uniref:Uncharacterized protein n=1 Tax=Mytilus coruscus TaxID=42192 RepID=A0A6J8DFD8_MYTCO|nr:unnamed protein product [Mytilus coruscus]
MSYFQHFFSSGSVVKFDIKTHTCISNLSSFRDIAYLTNSHRAFVKAADPILVARRKVFIEKFCKQLLNESEENKEENIEEFYIEEPLQIYKTSMTVTLTILGLTSVCNTVHTDRRRGCETTQFAIDDMYDSFVTVMKSEMSQKLPCKTVLYNSNNNKPRRCQKPWWTDNLGTLWNDVCKAEKVWTKCKGNTSKNLRHIYVEKRKMFDKSVQKAKRQYWFSSQEELMNTASNPKRILSKDRQNRCGK